MVAQAGPGTIVLFDDFFNAAQTGDTVADNPLESALGPFRLYGQGNGEADAGAFSVAGALSGAVRLTTTNEDNHTTALGTSTAFQPSLMAPLVLETRVQFNNLDTKEAFIGFSDISLETLSIETDIGHGATTTLTLTASDICGFLLSAELTAATEWHAIFNGGTTTGVTVSTTNELNVSATAGEWDVLRLEIDPNGTARWYINGVLKKTVEGAVSPSVAFAVAAGVEAKGAAVEEMDLDYLLVKANRDWTR